MSNGCNKLQVAVYNPIEYTVGIRSVKLPGGSSPEALSNSDVQETLNDIYKQAVISFTVTTLSEAEVDYDLNDDQLLDISANTLTPGSEKGVIHPEKIGDNVDYTIYLVTGVSDSNVLGQAALNKNYAFIYDADANKAAHEIGHALGLDHPEGDADNIMSPYESDRTGTRLRYDQWEILQGNNP